MRCIVVICISSGWACEGFRFNWIGSFCEWWTLCNILTFQWKGAMSGSLYRIILASWWNLSTFFIWAATQSRATILIFFHSLWFLQTLTLTMAMTFMCHTWAWNPYKQKQNCLQCNFTFFDTRHRVLKDSKISKSAHYGTLRQKTLFLTYGVRKPLKSGQNWFLRLFSILIGGIFGLWKWS